MVNPFSLRLVWAFQSGPASREREYESEAPSKKQRTVRRPPIGRKRRARRGLWNERK